MDGNFEEVDDEDEKGDFIAPIAPIGSNPSVQKFGRSKNFDPTQSWKWSKKSIAVEFEDMLKQLQEQTIEHEIGMGGLSGSDIEYMSDSDIGTGGINSGGLPNVDTYHEMLNEMTFVQSITDVKHPSNKQFKDKLDSLSDRISIFIKKVGLELTKTKNYKLKMAYQSAYHFLEEIQHEIESFDENINDNENKLNQMESKIKVTDSKYKALMIKFKNARQTQQESKVGSGSLKKQIHELSVEYSKLMLKHMNKRGMDEKTDEEWRKDSKDMYIPPQLQLPTVTQTILMKKVDKKKVPAKPMLKYPKKKGVDVKENPYIYDEFKGDKQPCVSQFVQAFGQEIGFFMCNRHG